MIGQGSENNIKYEMPRSVWFQKSKNDRSWMDSSNCHMFREDVRLGVVPLSVRRPNSGVEVNLIGEEVDINKAKILLSSFADHSRVRSGPVSFIERLARNLSWSGKLFFELLSSTSDEGYFILREIPHHNFFRLPTAYLQIVPRVSFSREPRQRFQVIRKDRIWTISMPNELGGEKLS